MITDISDWVEELSKRKKKDNFFLIIVPVVSVPDGDGCMEG